MKRIIENILMFFHRTFAPKSFAEKQKRLMKQELVRKYLTKRYRSSARRRMRHRQRTLPFIMGKKNYLKFQRELRALNATQ